MESQDKIDHEQNGDYDSVVDTIMNMFGEVISKEVIQTVVESCDGDLNLSVEGVMNMANDNAYNKKVGETLNTEDINHQIQSQTEGSDNEQNSNENMAFFQQNSGCPIYPSSDYEQRPGFPNINIPTNNYHHGHMALPMPTISQINAMSPVVPVSPIQYPMIPMTMQPNMMNSGVSTPYNQTYPVFPAISYSNVSQNAGAIPKKGQISAQRSPLSSNSTHFWTDQIRQILNYHSKGSRILVLMRGVPGSGKTYLASQIVEMCFGSTFKDVKSHIFSTDDYFIRNGTYQYNRFSLPEAHMWNQNRVRLATSQGLSPIIVDNTNVEIWEMEPYVREGIKNGYYIEVVEPNTPWVKNANKLAKLNIHDVPLPSIKRMLNNFQEGLTGNFLISKYGPSYPTGMTPPVLRSIPPIVAPEVLSEPQLESYHTETTSNEIIESNKVSNSENSEKIGASQNLNTQINDVVNSNSSNKNEDTKENITLEPHSKFEDIEKLENDWENGEYWEENTKNDTIESKPTSLLPNDPKPPRKFDTKVRKTATGESYAAEPCNSSSHTNLLGSVKKCQDWRQIYMFMPSWDEQPKPDCTENTSVAVATMSSATCMEIGDTDIFNKQHNHKVITATPRDINEFYMPLKKEKIPEKRMLDKSSMTNEKSITNAFRCKNEEKHFIAFRKLFKTVPKIALRDIFDRCCGDVNWAVDIVLGGMNSELFNSVDEENVSDIEEEITEPCDCLVAYNIIPDVTSPIKIDIMNESEDTVVEAKSEVSQQRKVKKDLSDTSMELKKHIEQNVVISDGHYSKHCLKIRKFRRGEPDRIESDPNTENNIEGNSEGPENAQALQIDTSSVNDESSDDDLSWANVEEMEKTVCVHIGADFVERLDELFGRKDMVYPEEIAHKINIPMTILNELNALWIESLMHQLDEQSKQSALMLQQDEEFARQIALKEEELAREGIEPPMPNFKEIMDMDLAVSLYQKDVAKWRHNEPNDLAAKMTRDKLYNLFPDVSQETLSELLMAHDNNFQNTVEVLLMSTGKTEILDQENGIQKFVMQKELERHEKILKAERKALSEEEWPLLQKGVQIEMSTVDGYREAADRHLARRSAYYDKAQEFINRGMTQVANYYCEIAMFHKLRYEHASSLAAASLIQVHASNQNSTTIDLHYLRVAEAKETLDLFLDTHIQKLKEKMHGRGPRHQSLFFITGRGLHSRGGPRIKPAVKKRLRERGLVCSERNPGLLTAKVSAFDKMSYQIKVP